MDQANGSPFKLVYSDWWVSRAYAGVRRFRFPFANGNHPAFIKKALETLQDEKLNNPIRIEKSMLRSSSFDANWQKKDPETGLDNGNYFRHGNFLGYYHKFTKSKDNDKLNPECIVSVDDVDINDNVTYYYPLEVECDGLRLISDRTNIQIDNEVHTYFLPDTWSDKLLELFRIGKVKIVVSNIVDPCGPIMYIKQFEDALESKGIDGKNLVWIQGNIPNYYYDPSRTHKSKMLTSILSLSQANENLLKYPCQTNMIQDYGYVSDVVRETDLDKNKLRDKKFICFNRSLDRPHRIGLAYIALKHDLLKDGIWSFLNHNRPEIMEDHLRQIFPWEEIKDIKEYKEKIKKIIPYQVDTQGLNEEQRYSFQTVDVNRKEYYDSTYIHIVSETLGWDEFDTFFSEKTWRPILNLQPFIYVGAYKSLDRLHKLGFKTFHPFIDERYDDERDMPTRMRMVEEQIVKFKNMSIQQIHDYYYSITDILLHNQNLLKETTNYNPLIEMWK